MKISIYIFIIVLASPFLSFADDNLNKDINDSLVLIYSTFYTQEKIDVEAESLVKKYGLKLVEQAKTLALQTGGYDISKINRPFGFAILVKLGICDPVKHTFLDLLKNNDAQVRNDTICALPKIDKSFAREVAVEAVNTTTDSNVKMSIIPLLGVVGGSNTVVILQGIEKKDSENADLKKAARQAREYLEYRLNLPTKEQQKSWADQAYIYWSVLEEERKRQYISITGEYYHAAMRMTREELKFSPDFLKYHLNQKDPLAVAIISVQKEKSFVEDLKTCLNADGNDVRIFKKMCQDAIKSIEQQEPNGLRDPNAT